jgi:hypothetical protein
MLNELRDEFASLNAAIAAFERVEIGAAARALAEVDN